MSGNLQSKQWVLWFVTAGRMFALVCFVVAGYLAVSDSPTSDRAPGESSSLSQASRSKESRSHATRPIETICVGDRVLGTNPEVSESERANWQEPEWESCLHLSLEMPLGTQPDSQEAGSLQIELLRPESWIRERLAVIADAGQSESLGNSTLEADGGTTSTGTAIDAVAAVPLSPLRPIFRDITLTSAALSAEGAQVVGLTLEMDLPEMGASGTAVITEIHPCPTVKRGDGQVVTATFAHPPSTQVLNVTFADEPEPIGVTDNHLFWSVDRQKFMAIGQMEVGERVQTYHGDTKRITNKLPRPGPQTVYNLEVYGEHVYFVGQQGLLAHNAYGRTSENAVFDSRANRWRDPSTGYFAKTPSGTAGQLQTSQFAERLQGNGAYSGVDRFRDITLRKGTIIYGGVPGQSNFYTTASGVRRSGGSARRLFEGLQVGPADPAHIPPHPITGLYRPGITAYEVTEDVPVAFARTLNNPQFGRGGLPQIVIEKYKLALRPLYSIPLQP